jgi:hypothetical protein
MPADEFELLQIIVDRMVDREHGKEIFRWQDFVDVASLSEAIEDEAAELRASMPDNADTRALLSKVLDGEGRENLFQLVEGVAHNYRRNPGPQGTVGGFSLDDLRSFYGHAYASSTLAGSDMHRLLTVLVQFAFFGPGRRAGSVDFTHHILADYLAGRYAVALLRQEAEYQEMHAGQRATVSDIARRASAFRQAIGTAQFAPGSLFHRSIAREMDRDPRLRQFVYSLQNYQNLGRENVTIALRLLAS